MKKLITILVLFFAVSITAQNYTIQERKEYDVKLDGQVVSTFNTLEEAQQYVADNTISSDTYVFDKNEWNIKEGIVTDAEALWNRQQINKAITYADNNGFTVFDIDNVDFFVEIGADAFGNTAHLKAIQIPSNFHFKMGENCKIRTQPNPFPAYAVLSARKTINTKITGGYLFGDKYKHTYTQGITYKMHDSGYGIYFRGVRESIVEGVTMMYFTGDGFNMHSIGRRNNDGSVPVGKEDSFNGNIVIRGNYFIKNRRNNISIIDGTDIIVENNVFDNAGEVAPGKKTQGVHGTVYTWSGVETSNGLDFEAWRRWDENGAYDTQFVNNVIVRNNKFKNSLKADINFRTASNIEIYGNDFDSRITGLNFRNVKIHDNNFKNNTINPHPTAIIIPEFIRSGTGLDENTGNEVYDNIIEGYDIGISVGGTGGKYYRNTIKDYAKAISLSNGAENDVYNNKFENERAKSMGLGIRKGGARLKNVRVYNQTFFGDTYGAYLLKVQGAENGLVIDNCVFDSNNRDLYIRSSNMITIKNSIYKTHKFLYSTNITEENNN